MTDHDLLRARLLARVVDGPLGQAREARDDLLASEWDDQFESWMRNRLLVGRFRYGRMDRADDTGYDRVGSMQRRLSAYLLDGNIEHLVDVANLAMMEARHGDHPRRHFAAADDGPHVERSPP